MAVAGSSPLAGREPFLISLSGLIAGLVLPVAMVAANRSAPLVVALAAASAIGGVIAAGQAPALLALRGRALRGAVAGLVILAALAFVSILWAHNRPASLFSLGEALASAVPAILLALAWRIRQPARLGLMLACGLLLAALLAIADLSTGMVWRRMAGIRPDLYVVNRSVMTQVVLLFPMLLLLEGRARALGLLAALAVAVAVFRSESTSAQLGLIVGTLAYGAARIAPRLAVLATIGGAALLTVLAPWIGGIVHAVLPAGFHEAMARSHSDDRVNIWQSFGAAVMERPLLGSGFNASARMAEDPVVGQVAEPLRALLGAGHPHNAFLQVWVDLGLAGAVIVLMLMALTGRALLRSSALVRPAATGLAATVLAIAAVSHGAWQGWWLASAGVALAITLATGARHERV